MFRAAAVRALTAHARSSASRASLSKLTRPISPAAQPRRAATLGKPCKRAADTEESETAPGPCRPVCACWCMCASVQACGTMRYRTRVSGAAGGGLEDERGTLDYSAALDAALARARAVANSGEDDECCRVRRAERVRA